MTLNDGSLTTTGASQILTQAKILGGGANALTGLQTIGGKFELDNAASLSDSAALLIKGDLFVDSFSGEGASSLADSASITNQGTLNVDNTNSSAGSSVTGATLTNSGFINLTGDASSRFGELNATASFVNNGAVFVIDDLESGSGAVTGTGTFDIWNNSTLNFDAGVSSGQTVTFDNTGALGVDAAGNVFQANIAGFGANDAVQLINFNGAGANWNFVENGSNTGGVLTLTNGSDSMQLNFAGVYSTGQFSVTGDAINNTATVSFV